MSGRDSIVETEPDELVQIRPFSASDLKEVRMLLGMSAMEQLAVANQRCYIHPLFLSIWVLVSCLFVQYMKWWPQWEPRWTWLLPLPAFASSAAPFLFGIDWFNRPSFEAKLHRVLHQEDVLDIQRYYSHASGSGFFVLSFKKNPIGCVAVDTAKPQRDLRDTEDLVPGPDGTANAVDIPKQPSSAALVRHFHLDAPYRRTGVASDLLAHAMNFAFAEPAVQSVYWQTSPLATGNITVFTEAGFKSSSGVPGRVDLDQQKGDGLFKWKPCWFEISRNEWARRAELSGTQE